MRFVVILFLVGIIGSLFSALWLMFQNSEVASTRMAKALTLRVSLSIALFATLMIGHYFGWIGPRLS